PLELIYGTSSSMYILHWRLVQSCDTALGFNLSMPIPDVAQWAGGHGREKEWNSCGRAIKLGMAVTCHHWPDMLQFLDSPVTDVTFKEGKICGCASKLGMAVPCHQWLDILRFLNILSTDVIFKIIGLGCAIPRAAGYFQVGQGSPRR
ncbi:hypothetical protein CSKR_110107, partial [Clonorchis sinensis]